MVNATTVNNNINNNHNDDDNDYNDDNNENTLSRCEQVCRPCGLSAHVSGTVCLWAHCAGDTVHYQRPSLLMEG